MERRVIATMFTTPLNSPNRNGTYIYEWSVLRDKLLAPLHNDGLTVSEFLAQNKPIFIKSAAGYYIMGPCGLDANGLPSRAAQVLPPKEFGIVSIDGDGVADGWDDRVKAVLQGYEYIIHATISSHRGDVRRRLVIPLASNVDADTREALIRLLVQEIGTQGIDKTCAEAKRAMVFPVVLRGGDDCVFHGEGRFLDAVEWLDASGKNWHDIENLPLFENEKQRKAQIQGILKNKIVETGTWTPPEGISNRWENAFCRTYRVSQVLEKYRPGYYTLERPGRYNHGEASGCKGGIQVINDAYVYSWYATDKLSTGDLMNAFKVFQILTGQTEKKALKEVQADPAVQETFRKEMVRGLNIPECAKDWQDKYDITDEGLARRCFEAYVAKRRDGSWWDYSDGIYKKVTDESMLLRVTAVARMVAYLQSGSDEIMKYVGSTTKCKAVLAQWTGLADAAAPAEDEWDSRPTYLCLEDCIIDLPVLCSDACMYWNSVDSVRAAIVEFSPEYLLTKKIHMTLASLFTIPYEAILEVNKNMALYLPDDDTRTYFWRCLGSCLDGRSYSDNKVVWLNGPSAGNGKSTVMSAITAALGSDGDGYAGISEVALFYKNRNDDNGEAASPKLEALRNTRLAHFAEGDRKRTINTSKVKNFTGGQRVYTRALYKGGSAWLPRMRMIFDSNGMPSLDESDDGFFRRLRIIPFRQKLRDIKGGEDSSVIDRWRDNRNIHAAILMMLLSGLSDWYKHGRKTDSGLADCPPEVIRETSSYTNSFDNIDSYVTDFIEITNDDKHFVSKSDFYQDYVYQCAGKPMGRHNFLMDLAEYLEDEGCVPCKRRVNGVPKAGWSGCLLVSRTDPTSWQNQPASSKKIY